MQPGMRRGLLSSVRHLAAVFLLEALVLGAHVHGMGGQWMSRVYGTSRPDVWEVFGGHSEVSYQAWSQGWLALQPIDKLYGADLSRQEERNQVLNIQEQRSPRLVLIEFPCTYWCQLAKINYTTNAAKQKLKRLRVASAFH